jgi:hypothetical protein
MLKQHFHAFLLAAIALALSGCLTQDVRYSQRAAEFQRSDPIHDAQAHFEHGDYAIYAAMGYSLYWPGLDPETGERLNRRFSSRHLAGTSDILGSGAQRRYIEVATTYASRYNREMLRLLKQTHKL